MSDLNPVWLRWWSSGCVAPIHYSNQLGPIVQVMEQWLCGTNPLLQSTWAYSWGDGAVVVWHPSITPINWGLLLRWWSSGCVAPIHYSNQLGPVVQVMEQWLCSTNPLLQSTWAYCWGDGAVVVWHPSITPINLGLLFRWWSSGCVAPIHYSNQLGPIVQVMEQWLCGTHPLLQSTGAYCWGDGAVVVWHPSITPINWGLLLRWWSSGCVAPIHYSNQLGPIVEVMEQWLCGTNPLLQSTWAYCWGDGAVVVWHQSITPINWGLLFRWWSSGCVAPIHYSNQLGPIVQVMEQWLCGTNPSLQSTWAYCWGDGAVVVWHPSITPINLGLLFRWWSSGRVAPIHYSNQLGPIVEVMEQWLCGTNPLLQSTWAYCWGDGAVVVWHPSITPINLGL